MAWICGWAGNALVTAFLEFYSKNNIVNLEYFPLMESSICSNAHVFVFSSGSLCNILTTKSFVILWRRSLKESFPSWWECSLWTSIKILNFLKLHISKMIYRSFYRMKSVSGLEMPVTSPSWRSLRTLSVATHTSYRQSCHPPLAFHLTPQIIS